MRRKLKLFRVAIHNIIVFTFSAIENRIPIWKWPRAWQLAMEVHRQEVHKAVWALKCEGYIYEDKNGYLWAKKDRE